MRLMSQPLGGLYGRTKTRDTQADRQASNLIHEHVLISVNFKIAKLGRQQIDRVALRGRPFELPPRPFEARRVALPN